MENNIEDNLQSLFTKLISQDAVLIEIHVSHANTTHHSEWSCKTQLKGNRNQELTKQGFFVTPQVLLHKASFGFGLLPIAQYWWQAKKAFIGKTKDASQNRRYENHSETSPSSWWLPVVAMSFAVSHEAAAQKDVPCLSSTSLPMLSPLPRKKP
jgi:hypothetical protein